MGHGANDKLYITHAEHSGALGQHSASSGHKQKAQAPHPGSRVPFDCCALSLQPFTHPVCARESDGTGTVFDLLNIIPWLKEHNNTHPISGNPLDPSQLIKLNYSKNANGELNDPVTFKIFSEHSHIVAIATTGNVFLAESVKQFSASGKDLVSDVDFKKDDIITLQDPHGFSDIPKSTPAPVASSSKTQPVASTSKAADTSAAAKKGPLAKAAQPYNASPYSSGNTGASLTSTAIAPMTETDVALFDEEELMYDDIMIVKKEKDRAKKRAYVRMVTNMGGSLNLELFCEKAPKTCYNFLMLARQGKYDNCPFHRLIPGFMVQGGDPTGTGRGGESYWGTPFRDEYDLKGAEKHTERGMLSMANKGLGTNGSQFFITFRATPHLDGKHTVFGKLVGGEEVLAAIEQVPREGKTDTPAKPILIEEVVIYQDPFQDYKQKLAKRLQAKGQLSQDGGGLTRGISVDSSSAGAQSNSKKRKERDDVNWFGVKLGKDKDSSSAGSGAASGSGVGKYLSGGAAAAGAKKAEDLSGADDAKKKRKLGFGNFDSW
ncbi:cyclophilin-like protein [Clavulina sp. PMI_390]|nr:cyclophilin-like protein [Clavulina sp. PMI_390]